MLDRMNPALELGAFAKQGFASKTNNSGPGLPR